jgi:hypothetical protein
MTNQLYVSYENNEVEVLTLTELQEVFNNEVDEEQKQQGTTFQSWLDEMLHMQIYNLA